MTLLSDFKTEIGETTNDNNQYYIDNFFRPALDKLSQLSANIKKTKVTLTNGTQSYDLTTSVADPVVGDAGIYEIVFDGEFHFPYNYKREVVLSDPTTLYFVDSDTPITGDLSIKYKSYYSTPTWSDPTYTETDAPARKLVYVKQWAVAHYYQSLTARSNSSGAVEEKKEDNLMIRYGNLEERMNGIMAEKRAAEEGMRDGGLGDFDFYSIQMI